MPPRRAKKKSRAVQEQERVPTVDLQIRLQQNIDFSSSLCSADYVRPRAGAYIHAAALHPHHTIAAFGTQARLGEYDLTSGCCLATAPTSSPPEKLAYSRDGRLIIALLEDRSLVAFLDQLSKSQTLLPGNSKHARNPARFHLAVSAGVRPLIFLAQHYGTAVRIAYIPGEVTPTKSGSPPRQGLQMKTDRKLPIAALATHPSRAQLFVAFGDGSMSGCIVNQRTLQSMWSVPLEDVSPVEGARNNVMRSASILAEPHPLIKGAALILACTSGGFVSAWELLDTKTTPSSAGKFAVQEGHRIVGAGVMVASACIVVFAKDVRGTIKTYAHRLVCLSSGTSMAPLIVQPENLQDAFGAQFKALQGVSDAADDDQDGSTEQPQELDKNTEHGFWTAAPIWSSESASSVRRGIEVARVLLHRTAGIAALQWRPSGKFAAEGVPIDALSASDALAAKQLMRATLMAVEEAVHSSPAVAPPHAPMHTNLAFWALLSGGLSNKLTFPRHSYLANEGSLAAYSLRSGQLALCAAIPQQSTEGALRTAHHLLHSPALNVCVLFCRTTAADGFGDGWDFARLMPRDLEVTETSAPNFYPGVSGAFVGANDELLAVLALDRATIQLFETEASELPSKPPGSAPAKGGGIIALFPGPRLRPPPPTEEEALRALEAMEHADRDALEPPAEGADQGRWLCWENVSGELCAAHLPPLGRKGRSSAPLAPLHSLTLSPGEHVVQVAWQALREDIDMPNQDVQSVAPAAVGAVLTSQRLLVVSPQMRVLLMGPPNGAAIVSFLWLGPALLYTTADHQVWLLRWDGRAIIIAAYGGGARASLLGALPDRLLLLRGSAFGRAAVAMRACSPLPALLQAWATLPASGLLPEGQWRARMEIRRVLETFDASGIDTVTLGTLVAAGFADLAVQLTVPSRALHLTAADTAAVAAAAGQWSSALVTLLAEYKRSIYFPEPPPKGSPLYQRLVILGRGAMAYGKFSVARDCFAATGQWEEVLPLCAFQGDFSALKSFTSNVVPGSQAARDAPLVEKLRWLLEARFARAAAIGARTITADWSVSMGGLIGDAQEAIMLATPGTCVSMEASVAGLPSDSLKSIPDVGAIDCIDATSLSAFVGGEFAAATHGGVMATDELEDVTPDEGFDLSVLEALAAGGSSAGGDWDDDDAVEGSVHSSNAFAALQRGRQLRVSGLGPSSVAPEVVDPDPTNAAFDAVAAVGAFNGGHSEGAALLDLSESPRAVVEPLLDLSDGVPCEVHLPDSGSQPPGQQPSGRLQDLLAAGNTPTSRDAERGAGNFGIRQGGNEQESVSGLADGARREAGEGIAILPASGSEAGATAAEVRAAGEARPAGEGLQPSPAAVPPPAPSSVSSVSSVATSAAGGGGMRPMARPAPPPSRVALTSVADDPFASSALLLPQRPGVISSGGMRMGGARPLRPPAPPVRVPSPGGGSARAAPLPALFGETVEDAPLQPLTSGLALPGMQRPTAANPMPVDMRPPLAHGRSSQQQQVGAAPAAAQEAAKPSGDYHQQGIRAMEEGAWDAAVSAFTQALLAAAAQRRPTGQDAQYLAAATLVKASNKADKLRGARLSRFAAAVNGLEERHRLALALTAANRNMQVRNYGYAGQQLSWLIEKSSGTASDSYLRQLQQRILECDRQGPLNATLPSDEDTAPLRLLRTADSPTRVEAILQPILQS